MLVLISWNGKTKTFGDIDIKKFWGQSCRSPQILSLLWRMARASSCWRIRAMWVIVGRQFVVMRMAIWLSPIHDENLSEQVLTSMLKATDLVRPRATFLTKMADAMIRTWGTHQEDLSGTFVKREQYQRIGPHDHGRTTARADLAVGQILRYQIPRQIPRPLRRRSRYREKQLSPCY